MYRNNERKEILARIAGLLNQLKGLNDEYDTKHTNFKVRIVLYSVNRQIDQTSKLCKYISAISVAKTSE